MDPSHVLHRLRKITSRLVFLTFALGVCLNASAATGNLSQGDILLIIYQAVQDAEQQITAHHGAVTVTALKQKIIQDFNLNSKPLPKTSNDCPDLGIAITSGSAVDKAKVFSEAAAYYIHGTTAVLKNHIEIAYWSFAMAASLAPACPAYVANLAFVMNSQGEYKNAALLLEYARKYDPGDSSIHINLAYSYQKLKRYDDAIQACLIAISLEPHIKQYQDMLAELQYLKKTALPAALPQVSTQQGSKPSTTVQLADALKLLEQKKEMDFEKELSSLKQFNPYQSPTTPKKYVKKDRDFQPKIGKGLDPSLLADDDAVCAHFSQHAHLLTQMGDEWAKKGGHAPSGDPISSFKSIGSQLIKNYKQYRQRGNREYGASDMTLKEVARDGALVTALVFYGNAGQIFEQCGSKDWPEADALMDAVNKEREQWHKDFWENLNKEEFSTPVCTYKICISRGSKGTLKVEVSDPWFDVELKMHPTNIYKYGMKLSKGSTIVKKGLGAIGEVSASHTSYFEWNFGQGMSMGTDLGVGASGGKLITTKADSSTSLIKYSFENASGGSMKP